ncbi:4012_t:CDS:1, partial [Funneliformis geosporum]
SMKIGKQKWCQECDKDEIENSRRKCPQCKTKLPSLAEVQEAIDQTIFEKQDTIKPLIFKSCQSEMNTSKDPIRTTQKDVNVLDILVPDPLPINPNSIKNVQKVIDYIKEISGINKGERKWIA